MNDLDSLLKNAKKLKDQNPPDDLVFSILEKKYEKSRFFNKYRSVIIMTSIISLISIVALFLLNNNTEKVVISRLEIAKTIKRDSSAISMRSVQQDSTKPNQIKVEKDTIRNTKPLKVIRHTFCEKVQGRMDIIMGKRKDMDLTNPKTIDKDSEGNPIPGILTLELNSEELKKLSITMSEDEIQWKMEKYFQIHPIPYRNNPTYWKNTEIEDYVNNLYPVNGDTLLIKNNLSVKLNLIEDMDIIKNYGKQSRIYYGRNDSIRKNVFGKIGSEIVMMEYYTIDTINGQEQYILNEKIISAPDSSLLFMDKNEYFKLSEKYQHQGFASIPQKFTGWRKQNYDLSLPLITAIKYRKSGRIKEIFYRDSPIYSFINYKIDYSKLIPITINFDNKIIERIVFWFYPTDEFISKLPQRYQNILSKEVNLFLNSSNNAENNCDELGGETFLDYCRSRNSSMLISSINPNPANDFANLKFELLQNSIIEISIHDSEGKFIGKLLEFKEYQKGSNDVKVNLMGLKNGLYLISIKNKNNEFVSKRLIINK